MTELTENIVKIIGAIPIGAVATYGQVAALAGNHRGARQVSWTLKTMTQKYDLPWQRVISSQGKISIRGVGWHVQRGRLISEGVEVDLTGRIDLKRFGWQPSYDDLTQLSLK